MKKVLSIALSLVMIVSVFTVCAVSANAETTTVNGRAASIGDKITYTYYVSSDAKWEDFQGNTFYTASGLKLTSFDIKPENGTVIYNTDLEGEIRYNGSSFQRPYDFTKEAAFFVAEFEVIGNGTLSITPAWWIIDDKDSVEIVNRGVVDNSRLQTREVLEFYVAPTTTASKPTTSTTATTTTNPISNPSSTDPTSPSDGTKPTTPPTSFPAGEKVEQIALAPSAVTLNVGTSKAITATIAPDTAVDKSLTWSSSDTKIATVDATGKITAKAKGTATVTATANDGSGVKAEVAVTVKQPVTKVVLNATKKTMKVKQTYKLTATCTPTSANNKSVVWKSSDTKVAKVSAGTVTALKKGTATITATTRDGSLKSAKCTITVTQPVTKVAIKNGKKVVTGKTVKVKKGRKVTLKAVCTPSNANNKKVTWKTSKKTIATVTSAGKVTAKKVGSATITATAKDGSKKSAKVTIKVTK